MEEKEKPKARIVGADGNVYNILGIASKTLKRAGMRDESDEMYNRVTNSKSYDDALAIILEYVDPVEVGYNDDYDDYNDINI